MLESKVEKDISFTLKDIEDEEKVKQLWRQCNQGKGDNVGSTFHVYLLQCSNTWGGGGGGFGFFLLIILRATTLMVLISACVGL